ncbi:MAG: adenosylcobinamide-GDP ribazoletransferase [Candidatus Omnitrophica bacterium]|nr:adenosylcobinamide-GDP ribazoletransferase [Candidatus Omnitrophota bacterium]
MKDFLIALSFLTRIPVSKKLVIDDKTLSRSMRFFPIVGFVLGAILVLAWHILTPLLPERLVSLILILLLTLLTGAMHLDGFADTIDGLCSKAKSKEEILQIMRDSRIGAMGVIGLILLFLLKWEALNNITPRLKEAALILMCTASRWSQVFSAHFSGYARDTAGLGKPFIGTTRKMDFNFATIFIIPLFLMFLFLKGLIALAILAAVVWGLVKYINKRIGGMTGDTIGAISELVEITVLMTVLILGKI